MGLLCASATATALAQEQPLSLEAIVASGFYTTVSREATETRVSFVPFSANLDAAGFLGAPGFLSFRVQPMLTTGPQATEAGFLGGNGIKLEATLLGGRSFPLKLRYSNIRREDVFFGSLNQVSGYRSMNHETNLGLNWQFRAPKLPQLNLDIGRSGLTADPNVSLIPDYNASNQRYALDIRDQRWGWDIDADLRRTELRSTFASLGTAGFLTTNLDQNTDHAGLIARRPLWRGARLTFTGGATDNRNSFDWHPYNQDLRYAEAALDGGHGSRWQWRLRAGYNGNALGAGMSELVKAPAATGATTTTPAEQGAAGSPTPVAGMPEVLLFAPYWNRFSNIAIGAESRLQLTSDWSLVGSVQRERVIPQQGFVGAAASDYLYGTAGINFQHRFSWATLGAQADTSQGRMVYAGVPNRFTGRHYSFHAHHGTVDRIELSAAFNQSSQRARQLTTLDSGSTGGELGVGRRVAGIILRGGAGLNRTSFQDPTLDYRSNGLSFRTEVQYRTLHGSYARNRSAGNTLSVYFLTPGTDPVSGSVLLGVPLRAILYSSTGDTLIVRANPMRRLETSFTWIRGRQLFDSQAVNDYNQMEMRVNYRFRLLSVEVGYIRYEQSLLNLSDYLRSRFYFRISRRIGIL